MEFEICRQYSTQLNGSGEGSYHWSPDMNINNVQQYNPVVNPLNTTTYVLTVTGQNWCSATDSVVITVTHVHELFI